MNVWTFIGRLGADAEPRTTQGGEKVLGFSVANDVGFGDRKTTQWVACSLWGRRGEAVAPHLTKGTQVCVSGEVTLREFHRRDGTVGSALAVRVTEVTLLGAPSRDAPGRDGQGAAPAGTGRSAPPGRRDDLDDEIPF